MAFLPVDARGRDSPRVIVPRGAEAVLKQR
jgi:hypothetical protein